jgi:hypothetical protein
VGHRGSGKMAPNDHVLVILFEQKKKKKRG